MLILFDNGTPAPLRYALKGHIVVEAIEREWDRLTNGDLIAAAEVAGFELLLTTDKNMRYQQNLTVEKLRLWSSAISNGRIAPSCRKGCRRYQRRHAGSYTEVEIPYE
jgi:hypothetical protein